MCIYDIKPGKEEYHTYIIGYGKNRNNKFEEKWMSMKLSNISNIYPIKEQYCISNEQVDHLNKKLIRGPEWINGDDTRITIEFTDYGLHLFKNLYKDRPRPESISNNTYTFIYDEKAMFNYLKKFGRHAKVIEPTSLKDKLKDFYTKAYNEHK